MKQIRDDFIKARKEYAVQYKKDQGDNVKDYLQQVKNYRENTQKSAVNYETKVKEAANFLRNAERMATGLDKERGTSPETRDAIIKELLQIRPLGLENVFPIKMASPELHGSPDIYPTVSGVSVQSQPYKPRDYSSALTEPVASA